MGKLIYIQASPRGSRSNGPSMKSVIVITGASCGFGELAARALAPLRRGRSR